MTRQALHVRAAALLLAALAAPACAGDRAAAPDADRPFDAARAQADAGAIESTLGAPVLRSFAALSGLFRLEGGAASGAVVDAAADGGRQLMTLAAKADGERQLMTLAAAGPSAAAARRVAASVAADVVGAAAAGTQVLPRSALGTTYRYDPTLRRYVPAAGRAGAPADGVRFILYAVNPVTNQPVTEAEIGHADLIDQGASRPSGVALRLVVSSGGATYLDYAFTADGTDQAGTIAITGYASDGTSRLNFDIEAQGRSTPTGATLDVTFELAVPDRGFAASGRVTGASSAFGAATSGRVELTVRTGDATVAYAVTGDAQTVNATVTVNGRIFATITGDPQRPEVRGAGGRALTAREGEALRQLFGLADGVFQLFGSLLTPVAAILVLSTVP